MSAFAAALVASGASAAAVEATDLEQRVQTPFRVYCESPWPYAAGGYARVDGGEAYLSSATCGTLRGPLWSVAFGDALTFFHELAHLGWRSRDEGAVECFALFTLRAQVRLRFGASRAQAETIYAKAWASHIASSPVYKPSWCRRQKVDVVSPLNGLR